MADVFVSYARSDKARVAPLVAALEAQGWAVWWDPAIAPGQEFDQQIAEELANASAVLVVWTPASVQSRWVRGEARDGADRRILVPVRFGAAVLPIDFRAFHTIDLDDTGLANTGPAIQEVVRALGAVVTRSRAQQPVASSPSPILPSLSIASSGPGRVAICVLPFTNLSTDPDQQAFSDGITGDIITELSRWRLLAVRSRAASFRFRGAAVAVDQVARDLNVRYVVAGNVRRIGDRIRINAELIDAETGSQVWGERFDRTVAEVFAVQDQLVQRIVSTLVGRVQVTDVERARRKPPASLDAYECVVRGNALPWDDPAGEAEAIRLFEKAIEIDPGYAMAHALLATMRCGQWRNDPGDSEGNAGRGLQAGQRAVELDDGESTCHSLLSTYACTGARSSWPCSTRDGRWKSTRTTRGTKPTSGSCSCTSARRRKRCSTSSGPRRSTRTSTHPGTGARPARRTSFCGASKTRCRCSSTSQCALFALRPTWPPAMRSWATTRAPRRPPVNAWRCNQASLFAGSMLKEPYKDPADAGFLAESLRLAGLPE